MAEPPGGEGEGDGRQGLAKSGVARTPRSTQVGAAAFRLSGAISFLRDRVSATMDGDGW